MTTDPRLDIIGAALADPSRSRILCELMDGRAFTNKELASAARVTPQTASAHLKRLEAAGLTASLRSGRHVYHRIASETVAETLETLAGLSPTDHLSRARPPRPRRDARSGSRSAPDALIARSCYNHIAGKLGVRIAERMAALDALRLGDGVVAIGPAGPALFRDLGLELPAPASGRPLAKLCLDWTERRHHLSGPLGTALLARALDQAWLQRGGEGRGLIITDAGSAALDRHLGLSIPDLIRDA